jgi:hypothetical protein
MLAKVLSLLIARKNRKAIIKLNAQPDYKAVREAIDLDQV